MSCLIQSKVKSVAQCADAYRIYINSISILPVNVIIKNTGSGVTKYFNVTPELVTVDALNISKVEFAFEDFGNFLISNSGFLINLIQEDAENLEDFEEMYIGMSDDETPVAVYAESIEVNFLAPAISSPDYATGTQTFKTC